MNKIRLTHPLSPYPVGEPAEHELPKEGTNGRRCFEEISFWSGEIDVLALRVHIRENNARDVDRKYVVAADTALVLTSELRRK